MSPLVSVITPMYNAEKHIGATLASVQAQTLADWEMLVTDNRSTDASRDIVRDFAAKDPRIRLIELPENSGGPARPRNTGLAAASGEFAAFLDADDLWEPPKLERQVGAFRSRPDLALVCTAASSMDAEGRTTGVIENRGLVRLLLGRTPAARLLPLANFVLTSSAMVRRSMLGGLRFDEDPALVTVEDWGLWISLARLPGAGVLRLEEPLVRYRLFGGSLSDRRTDTAERRGLHLMTKLFLARRITGLDLALASAALGLRLLMYAGRRKG